MPCSPVARTPGTCLQIRSDPGLPYARPLAGVVAATALVIGSLVLDPSQRTAAVACFTAILLVAAAWMTRTRTTEIDATGSFIRTTWRLFVLSWSRLSSLPAGTTAGIRTSRQMDGYAMPLFTVSLASPDRPPFDLYTTDDHEEAVAVLGAIRALLKPSCPSA
ncbi:MAG: hypothetical protein AB1634_14350 [Thermodesulfobacteriota bacterium]